MKAGDVRLQHEEVAPGRRQQARDGRAGTSGLAAVGHDRLEIRSPAAPVIVHVNHRNSRRVGAIAEAGDVSGRADGAACERRARGKIEEVDDVDEQEGRPRGREDRSRHAPSGAKAMPSVQSERHQKVAGWNRNVLFPLGEVADRGTVHGAVAGKRQQAFAGCRIRARK